MIRPVLTWPDRRLGYRAAPVARFDSALAALAQDMLQTMYDAPGRGLAAPQVGVALRLFVMDCHWSEDAPQAPLVCVNPYITWVSREKATMAEGCLSIPGIPAEVTRPAEIHMRWQGVDGLWCQRRFTGIEAVCAQHETDHLDGVLILDRIAPEMRATLLAEQAA